ncbi:MAG TPA: biotin-dependent carboxyltransferase family protein [Planctomycetota bacterium]|nr:biotin-dependent carboxyltransferase family protein [Planctomycetota bacterium]
MTGALEVLRPGPFTTVQDPGRFGYLRYGVPPSGPMDPFALEAGNLLVGNPRDAAALEVALGACVLRFPENAEVAVTGADLEARLEGRPAPSWECFPVLPGQTLSFGRARRGVWAYLAVAGGILVAPVMGSRATYTRARLGGHGGRTLARGDLLRIGRPPARSPSGRGTLGSGGPPTYARDVEVRVILGPDLDRFTEEAVRVFLSEVYRVTPRSDRMGYRLEGPPLRLRSGADIRTDAVARGTIQVASDGKPIVLLADRPATGGYARIATVIAADVWKVAQLPAGGSVSFLSVEIEEAQAEAGRAEARLAALEKTAPAGC